MVKIERLNRKDLVEYCQSIGIEEKDKKTNKKKTKEKLLEEAKLHENNKIIKAVKKGKALELLSSKIKELAKSYATSLKTKIDERKKEMETDDNAHYLIYRVLGITDKEGKQIDLIQNKGRFLYKYAGSFLEEAASLCLKFKNVEGGRSYVKNTLGQKPKQFEIDFLDEKNAIEIKWRDATTDGDHKTKEENRAKAIAQQSYIPIRIMFYYPQRKHAKNIQENLAIFYKGLGGQYYAGENAWNFLAKYTGYDLKDILIKIANETTP